MTKKLLILICVLLSFLFVSCGGPDIVDVRKTSDILLIMYMSGDANNGDNFFPSLQQAEHALSIIRNEDDTPKEGYESVNIIALWDGRRYDTMTEADPETKLLELGRGVPDPETDSGLYGNEKINWLLSSNTKDLSSTADWLFINGRQEVNMGSYQTLSNFLRWVSNHYKAERTILAFGDHGGGANIEVDDIGRSIIFDDDKNGDSSQCLRTCDVVNALNDAGYYGDNRVDLIIEDLCLGMSIEEVYGLKGMAQYFMASPIETWGNSMGYFHFISNFKKEKPLLDICTEEIDNYACKWPNYYPAYSDDPINSGLCSMVLVDLGNVEQIESIKTNVSAFAETVISHKGLDDESPYQQIQTNLQNDQLEICYSNIGNYDYPCYLKDLGFFMQQYRDNPSYADLNASADRVCQSLSDIVLYAYCSTLYYTSHENGTYAAFSLSGGGNEKYGIYMDGSGYGIAISANEGSALVNNNVTYKQATLFGHGNAWGDLIQSW